jgi:hypothetical protein
VGDGLLKSHYDPIMMKQKYLKEGSFTPSALNYPHHTINHQPIPTHSMTNTPMNFHPPIPQRQSDIPQNSKFEGGDTKSTFLKSKKSVDQG